MPALPMPSRLAESVAESGPQRRREWFARLPEIVPALAERWSLTLEAPYQPGGEVSWVAPARTADGRDVVLKAGWRHPDSEHEAAGLRFWGGRGAIEVFDEHVDDTTIASLLERCPGPTLGEVHRDQDTRDRVVARLLTQLWAEPTPDLPFRSLVQMCDAWADEFDERYADEPDALDPGLAKAGMELYRGLPRESCPQLVLVTDLHVGNVLAAEREPWLLIDPKPHVGDPCYDVLQHVLNDDVLADPVARAYRMAELAGLDRERVRLWLFARLVQECVEQPRFRAAVPLIAP
ncbi:aminoglycoside phosphotransferase family protein [Pseudonocardia sp. GCM10023141]|uniref:aminoglycoside phosphotransferase family protein n=1 Tax=Pseudonocardia sp. GCM10023141 TaxID=3252653 RepID=UPI003616D0AA